MKTEWHTARGAFLARCVWFLVVLAVSAGCFLARADTLTPAFRQDKLREIDAAVAEAIAARNIPGGVLWLEHEGNVYHRAYGNRSLVPEIKPALADTIYDAASLTKVVATTPAIMLLTETGDVELDAEVSRYVPQFTGGGKERVTVRQLLTHTSGLRPGIPALPAWEGSDAALDRIFRDQLLNAPGTRFRYSDINFILLGEIVKRVSGESLAEFATKRIFDPLGMRDTGFLPPESRRERIAPTALEGDTLLQGIVHDPTSRRMGGVAGHAGLFTTAPDLARFCRMLLSDGELDSARILRPESVREMQRVQTPSQLPEQRGLGWDIHTSYSNPKGNYFSGGFGHTGWTGTSLWIHPDTKTFVIFLSNRNHPSGGNAKELRQTLGTLAAEALAGYSFGNVRNGIDVLADQEFKLLEGLKVGLITNHTGVARSGQTTIDLLHEAPGVELKALFSPEHGIRGTGTGSEPDGRDGRTGLPVFSLYQDGKRKPSADQLRGLDALVFDIQDIGCRFYTYLSTMGLAMEAAAENGLRFIVLDRVNPIGGERVEGPVLNGKRGFTGFHEIPVRHGMTAGELATMFRAERHLDVDLTVVPLQGWTRDMWFDQTGLAWINPSPNMRSLTEAILYPGIGLLEFMRLSVGRGTDTPFELFGAPHVDASGLAEFLLSQNLPGVLFEPAEFTPNASVFKGERCQGVRITLTDRSAYRSVETGIAVATALNRLYPETTGFEKFATLLVHEATFEAVKAGKPLDEIRALWNEDLEAFRERREAFLLYQP